MYFKSGFASFLVFAMCLGCAKRNTPPMEPVSVKLTGTGDCLADLNREMTSYIEGKASTPEIRAFWGCMQASVQKFEDITSGDGPGGTYSPESLRQFIEHYFYKGHIPDDVLAGVMQVKRVVLGGSENNVTREELARLREFFVELNAAAVNLQPHVRVLFRKERGVDESRVRAAAAVLQSEAARIGAWFERQNQTLTFAQIAAAIDSIARWTQPKGQESGLMHTLRQAAVVLPQAKVLLVGGPLDAITGPDWSALSGAVGRGYLLYLGLTNGLDESLDAALTGNVLPEGVVLIIDVLEQSVRQHPNQQIPMQDFKSLFSKLEQTDWLSPSIKEPALTAATQWLFTRLLGDGISQASGLGLEQLKKMRQLTSDWQMLLSAPENSPAPLVREFNAMLASSQPIAWDSFGRMQFPLAKPIGWDVSARRHMIWPYVFLKLIKTAYAGSAPGLDESQVTTVAQEVLPVLQSFGWMLSTRESIGRRILREADLFTLASNGDGLLDLNEATRYLAFVVASYRTAQVWLESTALACPNAQAQCVRDQAAHPGSPILSHMPRLQKVMESWTPAQFTAYMKNAEQTILGAPEQVKFTTGELLQAYQLFEYVEVFLELYDRDQNESIDLAEATEAYRVYGPTLGRLLPSSDLGFFTFMFKYGDTPFTMYGGQIEFNKWQWHPDRWQLAADRTLLMSILSQLSKFASQ